MEPTYRAGYMQHMAVRKTGSNWRKNAGNHSIAFELLGPPRLSKLLYEIHIMRLFNESMQDIISETPDELSKKCFDIIVNDDKLRNEMLAIGIPILLPNGESLLRGNMINTRHSEATILWTLMNRTLIPRGLLWKDGLTCV